MSIVGLPSSAVDFWQRHKGTNWPLCGAGPCQVPAVLSLRPDAVHTPRCARHVEGDKRAWFFIDGAGEDASAGGTITTTYVRPRR